MDVLGYLTPQILHGRHAPLGVLPDEIHYLVIEGRSPIDHADQLLDKKVAEQTHQDDDNDNQPDQGDSRRRTPLPTVPDQVDHQGFHGQGDEDRDNHVQHQEFKLPPG